MASFFLTNSCAHFRSDSHTYKKHINLMIAPVIPTEAALVMGCLMYSNTYKVEMTPLSDYKSHGTIHNISVCMICIIILILDIIALQIS